VDFDAGEYNAAFSQSVDIDLTVANQALISLTTLVGPNSPSPIFLVFGIEFYQQVNTKMYPLSNGSFNALTVVSVNSAA
jgi:hypothetical protein